MPKDQEMKRGDKSEQVKAIFKEKGLGCPIDAVIEAFKANTGKDISRPLVYKVRTLLRGEDVPETTGQPITTEELREMREFIKGVGSLARTKKLLATVEELSQQLPT
jgi:hypothetical protein